MGRFSDNRSVRADLLTDQGPIRVADHPELRNAVRRAAHDGQLVRVLPGVFTQAGPQVDWRVRAEAVSLAKPSAVLTRECAAALTWWPELEVSAVTAALRTPVLPGLGIEFERRNIPADLIARVDDRLVTCAALTVLDLIPSLGGSVIDEALRRRAVTMRWLWHSLRLTRYRRGNAERAALLVDSRDQPWSELERLAHRELRQAGISGWEANYRIIVNGLALFVDVAFPALRLALEFDGWEHHRSYESFVADRSRDVLLARAGWRTLRFSASTLDDMTVEVADVVRQLRRSRER